MFLKVWNYFFKPGLAGGQTAYGGNASGEDLTLGSTSHATKGNINLQDDVKHGGDVYIKADQKIYYDDV